jgi:hypothetical protein
MQTDTSTSTVPGEFPDRTSSRGYRVPAMSGLASILLSGLVVLTVAAMLFFRSLLAEVQRELRNIRELMRADAEKRAMNQQIRHPREDGKQFDAVHGAISRIDSRLTSLFGRMGDIADELKRKGPSESVYPERSANNTQKEAPSRRQGFDNQVPSYDDRKDRVAQLLACANSLLQDPESLDGIRKRLSGVSEEIEGEPRGESRPDYFLVKSSGKVFVLPNGDRYTRIPSDWFNSADFRKATSKIEFISELPVVRPSRDGYVSERPGSFRVSD